tara:strand:+ start:192 stop:434 length:243 start_codon:yes stop_codon:yes gene_type:complete
MQRKIDHIYDNNILIAKEGGSKVGNNDEKNELNDQTAFMTNMQEEVRKLHVQLKKKDDMINSLKNFIDKNNEGMDENAVD